MPSKRPTFRTTLLITISLAVGVMIIAMANGRYPIGIADILARLWSVLTGTSQLSELNKLGQLDSANEIDTIIFTLRGPRVLAAFLVGGALAAAGAAYQNLFRNPLVSPDILGVSSGAALGAVIGIFLSASAIAIQSMAFVGGMMAVAVIYLVGRFLTDRRGGNDPVLTLVLIGVVISSLLGAGIALTKYLADPYNQLPAITYWLLGSFASVSPRELMTAAPLMIVGLIPLILLRWRINLLALPDDDARALGVNVQALRMIIIVAATLMTAAAVAICGIIGWVGLIVPHAVRLIVGADFSRLLPVSILVGGTLMVAVDTIGRTLTTIEIPPGVLTAVVGAPAFIWLMAISLRQKQS